MSTDRVPPQDIPAEMGVLGVMLASADSVADMSQRLRPSDFYKPAHATIFTTLVAMFTGGAPIDEITLASTLLDAGDLERIGGVPYLATLMERGSVGSAGFYAKAVADKATERRILELGVKAQQLAGSSGPLESKVAMVRKGADELGEHREVTSGSWAGDLVSDALDAIDAAGRGDTSGVIPTGFRDLDRLLAGGLRPGQLITVGGRPGKGKSTFGLDVARHITLKIRNPLCAVIISLEMPEPEIMQRLLSAEARVPLHMIRTGNLRDDEMARIIDQVQPISDAPLRFICNPSMMLAQIRAEARRLKQLHDLKLLVIDYLQLMQSPPGTESRQQFVADMSRGLKILALETGIAIIQASQLNRNPEARKDKRPELGDLRESGAVEQDSDIVILLDLPEGDDHPRAGEADFIVAKHRGGPTGTITVANRLHVSQFADLAIV